jgi:hypothetical protein
MPTAIEERWEFYRDGYKNWRWKKIDNNGNNIVESTDSFSTRKACVQNAREKGFTGKIYKCNCRFISMLVSSI